MISETGGESGGAVLSDRVASCADFKATASREGDGLKSGVRTRERGGRKETCDDASVIETFVLARGGSEMPVKLSMKRSRASERRSGRNVDTNTSSCEGVKISWS